MTSRADALVSGSGIAAALPFAVPVGLSAFLLFTVQPLVGRLVLPAFGGGPMVWATVLCFFQLAVIAGYAYGHISATQFRQWGPIVHLGLVVIAFVMLLQLPGAISVGSARSAIDEILALTAFIGLPAFVLAATTPLLSSWFEAGNPGRAGEPYRLFVLANVGSLLALFAYPLLVEPRLGIAAQRLVWTIAFGVLAVLIARTAIRAQPDMGRRARAGWIGLEETQGAAAEAIDWVRRGRWLIMAAVPSGLLSAVTTVLTLELMSAPLLWVLPLGLYLLSLILAFSARAGRLIRLAIVASPAAATLLWASFGSIATLPILAVIGLELVGFVVIASGLHGRLAQDRPHAAHMTDFYLTLAGGAALGTVFAAILAPLVFPALWEFPILVVAALAAFALAAPESRPPAEGQGLTLSPFLAGALPRVLPYVLGAPLVGALLVVSGSPGVIIGLVWLAIGGLVLLVGGRPWFLAGSTLLVVVLASAVLQPNEFRGRSFFGVSQVLRSSDSGLTTLVNGTAVHGSQWIDPAQQKTPTAYYGPAGPAGDIFAVGAQQPASGATQVGVVGLGAGELSSYADPFTIMTYFEIDPVVVRIAEDPDLFTYLSDAPGDPRIVVGDGRRSLAAEPDATFNLLVLDAYAGNAVPIHLMTVEAIGDALRTVEPDGVIAFHISNRFFDLAPPIAASLQRLGLTTLERSGTGDVAGELPSRWLATTRNPGRLDDLRSRGWTPVAPADRPFTDDYADLVSYLRFGF